MQARPANATTQAPLPAVAVAQHASGAPGSAVGFDVGGAVVAAARGDQRAWTSLVRAYSGRVYALAKSRTRNDAMAEEITQSVFVTVATKLNGGAYAEQGRFESWLFRIAMNRIRDEMRRVRRHAAPTDPATLADVRIDDGAPDGVDPAHLGALRDALTRLSAPDREIIELRHHAGLSFAQISEALRQPLGTVLARHHRALKKLRSILETSETASFDGGC